MYHETTQTYQSENDITVYTHGRKRPCSIDLSALRQFHQQEGLTLPRRIDIVIDQRSPLQRVSHGSSFFNPNNTLIGRLRECQNAVMIGYAESSLDGITGRVLIQTWPLHLRAIQESILKHELHHLGNPYQSTVNSERLTVATIGSIGYYLVEQAYPIIPGMWDNNLALGSVLTAVIGYHILPFERQAIMAQLRRLDRKLLIKE